MSVDLSGQIQSIVADQLGVEQSEVTKDASILDDLGADSLDVVELVMTLEDAFDIEVPDEAVEEMRTIGDFYLQALSASDDDNVLSRIRTEVSEMCAQFPVPAASTSAV